MKPSLSTTADNRRRFTRVRLGVVVCCALAGVTVFPVAGAQEMQPGEVTPAKSTQAEAGAAQSDQTGFEEITPAQQIAVRRGLEWLAKSQDTAGAFGGSGGGFSRHAGITALAAIAFMQDGNLPGRGKYGANVQRALDFVLASCQESGLISSDNSHGPMYGHGFATLFLAEVYGMTGNENVRDKLQRAVRLIQQSQNQEGGWRYQPVPYDADVSVTICQVMALRAARDAGIKVDREVIDKAIAYVRKCQNDDGGFSYQAHGGSGSLYPRSAAGIATLYYAGISQGNEIERGLTYLRAFTPGKGNEVEAHYYYGHYYGVQAMFMSGGEFWREYYPAVRDQLISRQNKTTGAWQGDVSEDYATAMALIILQMPNRYLPVYSGKGPGS